MWVVSLLVIYMLFLMCLDPLVNKKIKSTAYQEHTNEDWVEAEPLIPCE